MSEFKKLKELLIFAENPSVLGLDADELVTMQRENMHLSGMLKRGVRVYGMNTAVGHRDTQSIDEGEKLWLEIVDSHFIGTGIPYSLFQTRCIGFAKLMQWRSGRSGVSPNLFIHVARVIADCEFSPIIPSGQSYSSGDVIPATHWAVAVLQGTKSLSKFSGAPEPMPLINGSFLHVGLAAASIPIYDRCFDLWLSSAEKILYHICRNNSLVYSLGRFSKDFFSQSSRDIMFSKAPLLGAQDAVSVRASLDVADVMRQRRDEMGLRLNNALSRPSSNPLINDNFDFPISQASFLEPGLVIAQSAFIETILLAMWVSVSRIQYVLSGQLASIPMDGGGTGLGMIQRPKRMLAILEHARIKAGRRVFASGGSSSNGIEDLWTNGVFISELIEDLCNMFEECCKIESDILNWVL